MLHYRNHNAMIIPVFLLEGKLEHHIEKGEEKQLKKNLFFYVCVASQETQEKI